MSKARAESVLAKLPASRRNPAAESTPEERGNIPSWALQPFDLDEPRDQAPTGMTLVRSPLVANARPARIGSSLAPLMTVAEAATALRVSTKTVRRMLDRGELHRVRVGRLVRIHAEEIVQYIGKHTSV
jgi:excisionase family DNA binding protein